MAKEANYGRFILDKIKGAIDKLMNKCPNCQYELTEDQNVCPNCGHEINAATENHSSDKPSESNDNINWSEFRDVPIGEVMEELSDLQEDPEENDSDTTTPDTSILADYIKKYKEAEDGQKSITEKEEPHVEEMQDSEVETKTEEESETIVPIPVAKEESITVPEENKIPETKEPSEKSEEKPKKNHAKKYLLLAAVALVVAGGSWMYYDNQQKEEAARQEEIRIETAIADIDSTMDQFFLDSDQQFIVPGKTSEEIAQLMQELDGFSEEEEYDALVAKGQKIQIKLAVLDQINSYFSKPVIVGDELIESAHINEGATVELAPLSEENAFAELVNTAIKKGHDEVNQLLAAEKSIQELMAHYRNETLAEDVSRDDFESAKEEVNSLFDGQEKESMLADLLVVEKALVNREIAEEAARVAAAEKRAEEERIAAEEAAQEAAEQQVTVSGSYFNEGQEILSPSTPKNQNSQPIISYRQSDLNDVNNAAWSWAPGIYEEVINKAIARGYVVEGGFYLEPVRIENGEGYYNLYATSNSSSLMQGMPSSSMPFYLFTVNNKTGFFRGNGHDENH